MEAMDHSAMAPQVRKYFIAAEVTMWDYAPSGRDVANDAAFTAAPAPRTGTTTTTRSGVARCRWTTRRWTVPTRNTLRGLG